MIDFRYASNDELKKLESARTVKLSNLFVERKSIDPIINHFRFNLNYYLVGPFLINEYGDRLELSVFNKNIHLAFIGVGEGLRRQGRGTRMMEELIELANKFGYSIDLNVTPKFGVDEQTLIKFYEKFGFKKWKRTDRYVRESNKNEYLG